MKVIKLAPALWVMDYDVDAGPVQIVYPTGVLTATEVHAEAKRFPTTAEAFEFYRRVSTRTPLRPDGRPNRPMTKYTVRITDEDDMT